jgi:hypothetical protein
MLSSSYNYFLFINDILSYKSKNLLLLNHFINHQESIQILDSHPSRIFIGKLIQPQETLNKLLKIANLYLLIE